MITAALSCPNEKIGKRAYLMACQHLGWDLDDPLRGVAAIDLHITINLNDENGCSQSATVVKFDIDDFEFAESQTKECLSSGNIEEWYDHFMKYVDLALKELMDEMESAVLPCPMVEEEISGVFMNESILITEQGIVVDNVFDNTHERSTVSRLGSEVASMTQTASGKGHPKSAVTAHNDSIERANEPLEVIVKNDVTIDRLSEQAIFRAEYRAGLALKYGDDAEKWLYLSDTKYNGKGWTDIARAELKQRIQEGKRASFTEKDVEHFARTIQNGSICRLGVEIRAPIFRHRTA